MPRIFMKYESGLLSYSSPTSRHCLCRCSLYMYPFPYKPHPLQTYTNTPFTPLFWHLQELCTFWHGPLDVSTRISLVFSLLRNYYCRWNAATVTLTSRCRVSLVMFAQASRNASLLSTPDRLTRGCARYALQGFSFILSLLYTTENVQVCILRISTQYFENFFSCLYFEFPLDFSLMYAVLGDI